MPRARMCQGPPAAVRPLVAPPASPAWAGGSPALLHASRLLHRCRLLLVCTAFHEGVSASGQPCSYCQPSCQGVAVPAEAYVETWLVQEPCSLGTLAQAIHTGQLCERHSNGRRVDVAAVLATAREVAGALAHLHGQGLMHGNLSSDWRAPGLSTACASMPGGRRWSGFGFRQRLCSATWLPRWHPCLAWWLLQGVQLSAPMHTVPAG